ncbi:MAG: esterase-like activity of phytase family protein [Planctomycetota bacterium]|nr:esterase-like activity of phytase family protein [Planctomycetota bacterium]
MRQLVCLIALSLASAAHAQLAVTFRNGLNLAATTTDQNNTSFTVAGMSGISFIGPDTATPDPDDFRFVAVMDNSNKLVFLRLKFAADGTISAASITGGLSLALTRDFEDVVFTGATRNSVFASEEDTPAIHEFSLSGGGLLRTITVPPVFANRRSNFGLESLAMLPLGTSADVNTSPVSLWTLNEEALSVDGPLSTPTSGTVVRAQRFEFANGVASAAVASGQFAYRTDPIHAPTTTGARSGVSALVLLESGQAIVMERSFGLDFVSPFQTRLYDVSDTSGATDTSGFASLVGATYAPIAKRLLYRGNQTNLEGLCIGPRLAGGKDVLVGIVDDGDPISVNRVVAFELSGVIVPCAADFNGDGFLDFTDFDDFVTAFESGAASSDFNSDGFLDFTDFDAFVAAFEGGC